MASIDEIAKAAGVSRSTVSKALNSYSDISEKTRQHVVSIAQQLQYTPNLYARGLALQKPSALALVFSDVKDTDNNGNIIFRLFISAIHHCQQQGYELLTIHTDSALQKQKSLKSLFDERRIGGAIFYGFKLSDAYIAQVAAVDVPVVLIDIFLPAQNTSTITINNGDAIYDMLAQVVRQNRHQKICVVNGLADSDICKIRWQAFLDAAQKLGIPAKQVLAKNADFLEDKAYRITTAMYKKHPDITCFFCMSDIMAIGAMRALRDMGLRVPEDVAVTGFDGIQISDYVTPPLTTIQQDFKEIGNLAAQTLIARLNDEPAADVSADRVIYAPYSLRVGGSL